MPIKVLRRWLGKTLLVIPCALFLLSSCKSDEVQYAFCSYKAFFRYDDVINTFPLKAALASGSGLYCSIYPTTNSKLIFQAPGVTPLPVNVTAIAYYSDYINPTGCGFIVGCSNVPDATTGELPILCYDRGCPNCYENLGISKPLSVSETGMATCPRCNRVYDLNNLGIISSGEKGIKLFRFRVAYDGSNTLIINNQGS